MAIPNQPFIELPLLLELERVGGRVEKRRGFPAFYDSVAKHFPDLNPGDRAVVHSDGKTRVFDHTVEFGRNRLKDKGQLDGTEIGVWEITQEGKRRLRSDLANLGITDLDNFISSDRTIAARAGSSWQPKTRRPKSRVPRPPKEAEAPEEAAKGQGPETLVTPGLSPPSVPVHPQTPSAPASTIEDEVLARIQSLAPMQFEALIAEFLKAKGLSDVRVTGRSGDGGIDGDGNSAFLKLPCCFQAKRYAGGNQVGAPDIRNFKGGMVGKYDRGIFVTTSGFTAGAKEEADQPGATIILIDGNDFVGKLLELGLGIKTTPVVERSVDENFFDSLAR